MSKQIIIYGSQYGSTKRYAKHLAEITGIDAIDYKEAKNIDSYDRIIYLGALYAGGVTGLKKTVAKISPNQELIVATVGLADPTDQTNIENIRRSLKDQLPEHFHDEKAFFHLRGAINYSKLGIKHRIMMSMLHSKVSKMPEEKLNAEAKAMLATYGKQVDFVDFSTLKPIEEIIKA